MSDYFYPPLSNPIQPPPPALPLWRSRRDRKHQYIFILENIAILAEPSQPPEPAVVAQPSSGQKRKLIKIEKGVNSTENQLPSAKLSWCRPRELKKIKIEDPEGRYLY